jgi:hypothetical protein
VRVTAKRRALRVAALTAACAALLFIAGVLFGNAVRWVDDDYCFSIAYDLAVKELVDQRTSLLPPGMECTYETAGGRVTRGPLLMHTWYALALIPCVTAIALVLLELRKERTGEPSRDDRHRTMMS